MKTQTSTNKISKVLFTALASLVLMNTACQKNSGNNSGTGVVTPVCTVQPCVGVVGGPGQGPLYGGTTTNGFYTQSQFQVTGDQSGYGVGYITGTVNINNYVCQVGQPNLNGPFTIQMTQQGVLQADVFTGNVMLVGPQGSIPASIKVVPSRTQGAGLFSVYLCGYENSSNF